MAPTAKPEAKKATPGKVVKKTRGKARNYDLGSGVYRFSKSKMYHKKAKYRFVGKKLAKVGVHYFSFFFKC